MGLSFKLTEAGTLHSVRTGTYYHTKLLHKLKWLDRQLSESILVQDIGAYDMAGS